MRETRSSSTRQAVSRFLRNSALRSVTVATGGGGVAKELFASIAAPLLDGEVAVDEANGQAPRRDFQAMHAHPCQSLQHHGALALQVAGDDRLGDRPEARRLGIDDIGQQRIAQRDEDHGMAVGHALEAFQQQPRRRGVDEFGEQDDQRPALQAGVELGEPQREIGLLGPVAELARGILEPGEGAPAGRGLEILPDA